MSPCETTGHTWSTSGEPVCVYCGEIPSGRAGEPLTADTITDEQIRELWKDPEMRRRWPHAGDIQNNRQFHARCAEIWNARAKEGRGVVCSECGFASSVLGSAANSHAPTCSNARTKEGR